ncbi:MAG: heavy-metal-associated domain-containing protein [Planctomycetota bacterium]|jgi:copper chaperone CopZ
MKKSLSLLCVCIGMCLACDLPGDSRSGGVSIATPSSESVPTEPRLISLKVEGMTCPSGCYPSVRSAIAKQDGVVDVELAPQQKEDVIDNPVVFVRYNGELDLKSTLKAIQRAGFEAEAVPQ